MSTEAPTAERELPRYRSHKIVHALKLRSVSAFAPGGPALFFEDEGYAPLTIPQSLYDKHKPEAGWYYVVYPDGYKSFSPAQAFEEGYTRL